MHTNNLADALAEMRRNGVGYMMPRHASFIQARDAVLAFLTAPLPLCSKCGEPNRTALPFHPVALIGGGVLCLRCSRPRLRARPDPINESPTYRSAMKDAGRRHLLR